MNKETLTQIFLDRWREQNPAKFKAQDRTYLTLQATARAELAMAEIEAERRPGQTTEEVWSEIASPFLKMRMPTHD